MTTFEPNAPTTGPDLHSEFDVTDTSSAIPTQAPAEMRAPSVSDPSAPAVPAGLGESLTAEEFLRLINGAAAGTEAEALQPLPLPLPLPRPFPLPFRASSGRYRSAAAGFQLELRVDVDGRRPLNRVSGDYYSVSGATTSYFGSWTVDAVIATSNANTTTIVGTARTTWSTTFTVATVTIPRTVIFRPAPAATVEWSTPSGAKGARYVCNWEAGAFRTVELEQDCESGVAPFVSYNTGTLASGGPARTLSVAGAYGEAGLQMLDTGGANIVNTPANHVWTNASLHNAMRNHFSRWQETTQFKVWLLHAQRHEFTTATRTLLGIMFDQQGLQRQGCATFYERIAANNPQNQRTQLHTNVHELGHCFNLFHSFHKDRMTPPLPNRLGSLSWMNYPQEYNPGGGAPSGAAAFWAAFPFQFDDLELAHVRHGFRNAVIMGGNPFGTGAAFESAEGFADSVADTSGLRLRIKASDDRPMLGSPVVLEITLVAERAQQVEYTEHPSAVYAQAIVGMNAARPFTDVAADGSVQTRPRGLDQADQMLGAAIDASRGDGGMDDLTVYQVAACLADSHEAEGDTERAHALRADALHLAESKNAPESVLDSLRE